MTEEHTDTLSAFVDGEPVDPDRLAVALEDAVARAALVDFVRMRAAVRTGDAPLPESLRTFRPAPFDSLHSLRARWAAVAALLVLVFLAGLLAPRPWGTERPASDDTPPSPTRVEKFTPGVDWHQSNQEAS